MSTGRQSAFAKRRKLNNGSGESSPRSTPELLVDIPSPASARVRKHEQGRTKHSSSRAQDLVQVVQDETVEPDGNSFEPLVNARKVEFSEIREIEYIDQGCVKVRLSESQSCYIRGIGRLWVRDGTVAVNGTTLKASPTIHNVFSIDQGNRVCIEAISKTAEFQLESVSSPRTGISTLYAPGKIPREYCDKLPTFDIVPVAADGSSTQNNAHRQIIRVLEKLTNKSVPTVLTIGHSLRNIEVATSVINHFLSQSTDRSVEVLDLDYTVPMSNVPGCISSRTCHQPILGPPYTDLALSSPGIVDTCYIGSATVVDSFEHLHSFVSAKLQGSKNQATVATVIRLGAWIVDLSPTQLAKLKAVLRPDLLLFVGRPNNSLLHKSCQNLVNNVEADTHFIATESTPNISSSQYLQLSMQSHFYAASTINETDMPLWYAGSLPSSSSRRITFSHSFGPQLPSLIVIGGQFREQDIEDILEGAFVILLAYQIDQAVAAHRQQQSTTRNIKTIEFAPATLALGAHCLGLAYVEHIDTIEGILTLNTPIPASTIEIFSSSHQQQQQQQQKTQNWKLAMLLQKPSLTSLATTALDRNTLLR